MAKQQGRNEPSFADQLAALEALGYVNRQEQAAQMGLSWSAFKRHMTKNNITPRRRLLTKWLPGPIAKAHHDDPTARKLRFLASAADERDTALKLRRAQTLDWARGLVNQDLDIIYDRKGGFQVRPAVRNPQGSWYLRDLVVAAEEYIATLHEPDDQRKCAE